ncbi:MAG: SDR family NAD(P)-dependent oxidoreductase [Anaerolineae bacterium]
MQLLENKVAVVTGGGRGIGREISLACANAGADVVLAARSEAPLQETRAEIEALGRQALAVPTDVSDPASVQRCAERVLDHFGRVDVLVNNSGVGGPAAPLWEIDLADWQETFAVNVTGVFLCCRAFLPSMVSRRSGSVIIIGSMTGKRPLLNRTPYAASKLALVGLARTLAWETGPYGVRVNVISPGPVAGARLDWVFQMQAEKEGISVEAARQRLAAASPLERFVPGADVANAAVFLASDLAGSTTGEDLNVSAGIAMY